MPVVKECPHWIYRCICGAPANSDRCHCNGIEFCGQTGARCECGGDLDNCQLQEGD